MFNLLRKIFFHLKGKSNDLYEDHSKPVIVLRQAAREMAEQRKKLRGVWVELDKQVNRSRQILSERESQYTQNSTLAKKARDEGDDAMAMRYAERCLSIKNSIELVKKGIEESIHRMTAIEDEINKLGFEEDNLKLEATMAESTVTMSRFDNDQSSAAGTSSEHIKDMIESARERVKTIELDSSANRAASQKFDNTMSSASNADAKAFLDNL